MTPSVIGRYRIRSVLGRGSTGVVYRAYDPQLNRHIALKVVAGAREEAQVLARLSHPNVVTVHDVGTVGDDVFVAMELVDGVTLRAWLAEQPRSPREILRVFGCAGAGLAAAHEAGVVHRDFTTDNVMIGRDGRVRVVDLGTPAHAAAADEASDQLRFCAALYEALLDRQLARGIRSALLRGLRVDPAERHPSLQALLTELAHEHRRSPRRRAMLALAAVALAGGGWIATPATAEQRGSACGSVDDTAAALWNPLRRAQLVGSAGERTARSVDVWVADWANARRSACTRSNAEQLQCLERRRGELDGLLSLITTGGRTQDALALLHPVAECIPTPAGDRDQAAALPVVRQVVQATLALNAGKLDEARTLARSAVAGARALRSRALSSALLVLGQAQGLDGDYAAARASYREAATAAAERHDDGQVADAWLATVQLAFREHKLDASVDEALFAAKLAIGRLDADSPRIAMHHHVTGSLHVLRNELAAAIPELEQAIAGWERLDPKKYAGNIAPARNALGMLHAARGAWAAATSNLEQALAGMRALGAELPQVATVLANLALVELYQEHYAEAEGYMRRSLAISDKLRPSHPLVAQGALLMATIHVESGRCATARPELSRARRLLERANPAAFSMALLEQARCTRDRRTALALLARAHALAEVHSASRRELPEIEFSRAQLLDRRDRVRAITLARQARAGLVAAGGGTAPRVRRIDAWLAARAK